MLNKSEMLVILNTSNSHIANWQQQNSSPKRQKIGKQKENHKSAFGSYALDLWFSAPQIEI